MPLYYFHSVFREFTIMGEYSNGKPEKDLSKMLTVLEETRLPRHRHETRCFGLHAAPVQQLTIINEIFHPNPATRT